MASGPVNVSEAIKVDPQEGDQTTITVESFVAYPQPPAGAKDIHKSHEDGKFILRYTVQGSGNNNDPVYTISGSVSQEPLATHAMFRNGTLQVSADEWKKWKQWESDPANAELAGWKPDGSSASAGMKKYYAYRNRGVEDYLLGTVTMRISEENQGQPNLANLGHIARPSHAPALPDQRDWLLVGVDAERVARVAGKSPANTGQVPQADGTATSTARHEPARQSEAGRAGQSLRVEQDDRLAAFPRHPAERGRACHPRTLRHVTRHYAKAGQPRQ